MNKAPALLPPVRLLPVWPLAMGVIVGLLVALPLKVFELDRYFVPKELLLHLVALAGCIVLAANRVKVRQGRTDTILAFVVALTLASALFATNHWLGQRAVTITLSSVIVFWYARAVAQQGRYRPILVACAVGSVLCAFAALAQAYGFRSDYFSLNRAPGGLFGNRNFVAHVAAIGLPSLLWSTLTARRAWGPMVGAIGGAIVTAALILSRSRAAWLALATCLIVLLFGMLAARAYWRSTRVGQRLGQFVIACGVGACLAIALPNSLNWNSDSPYLDSAKGMVEYKKGSGRGRVAQYENSLRMAVAHPILGVGPGNWPVQYPQFAPAGDRSLADDGMTANPWPSSDWMAFVSERGFIEAIALLSVFTALFVGSFRDWASIGECDRVLARLTLAGTIAATLVVGMFDAALLLAAPSLLVWSILGAASGPSSREVRFRSQPQWAVMLVILLTSLAVVRSATQIVAMYSVGGGARRAGWTAGAAWDPGSYRINLRVAELSANRGRCTSARDYAHQAATLFPHASAPKRILNRCR